MLAKIMFIMAKFTANPENKPLAIISHCVNVATK